MIRRRSGLEAIATTTTFLSQACRKPAVLAAIAFLAWCRDHETTLGTCTQAHVELWLAGAPGRRWARDFVRWACRRGLAHDLDIMRRPQGTPARSVDADEHLILAAGVAVGGRPFAARRFAVDESVPLADRVAGLLLLCYGQPLTRLAKLTADHIVTNGHLTSIRFGCTRVEVSVPVGELLRTLLAARSGHATTGAPEHTPWLFPGEQPGRPLTPSALGTRLGSYGIDARAARTSLLLDLASELPPVVLADLLGLHPNTAVRWVRAANGDWSEYAAAKARRLRCRPNGRPGSSRSLLP